MISIAGKRVLIIGLGNSAADIAADVSNVATHTSLSTRSGAWVVSRRYKVFEIIKVFI